MDPTLHFIHVAAVIALFAALGAVVSGSQKWASALHGISLITILAVGFAMLKKPPMTSYWWMVKLALWLFLGAAPALAKRNVMAKPLILILCIAAGIGAAYLGYRKPF